MAGTQLDGTYRRHHANGQDIGVMRADVKKGEHLHVHNAKTKRW